MSFKMGYSGMEVQSIRAALGSFGFHPNYAVMDPNLFDAWVEAAVKAFQLSKGLSPDGIVGPNTWAALNGTSVQPSMSPSAGTSAGDPNTQLDPGKLSTTIPGAAGAPASSPMPMVLFAGAAVAVFLWWKSRKGGLTLAGLPFGAKDEESDEEADARAEAKKERERQRRKTAERIERITEAYEIEVKRTGVNPVRAPGHAQALMNRVARAEDKATEIAERDTRPSIPYVARQEELKEKAVRSARGLVGGQQQIAKGSKMYKSEHTKVGRKLFPGNTSPTDSLRNRTEGEDEKWLERVESTKPAAQSTKRVVVQSKRYHTDKAYRESEQADARRLANDGKREVQLVNERGVSLYKFQPNVRDFKGTKRKGGYGFTFKDAASERLIEEVESDAKKKNCPKAVRNLFRVRPLALDERAEQKLDLAAAAVAKNCSAQLEADLEFREEAREEAGGERPASATIREVKGTVGLARQRRTTAAVFTPKAIQREIEKGNISEEDGEALLIMARDEAKRIAREADIFEPARGTSKMTRKRKGELDAQIYISPSGSKRTLRAKNGFANLEITNHGVEMLALRKSGEREIDRLTIEREHIDHGHGVNYDTGKWLIARSPGGTLGHGKPYAWADSPEELLAWAKKNKIKASVL